MIEKTRRARKNQDVELKLEGACMVIKANGSEVKISPAVGLGRYLAQKFMRSRKIETLMRKEKYEAVFATLEDNIASNEMVTDEKTMRSDAFFRFTIAARADVFRHWQTSSNGAIS
jgi:hypothetical protein